MKIKGRAIFIHARIDHLKYIDAAKFMHALRKHIDWSKSSMLIPYEYDTDSRVYIDITSEYVDAYFQ